MGLNANQHHPSHAFTESEKERLLYLAAVLGRASPDLSLPQLVTVLTIALEPGLSVNDLAERLKIPQQSASRHVSVLLGRYQLAAEDATRPPLIEQTINPRDPRKRALYLTARGRDEVAALAADLRAQGATSG
jgi:DNA-binding MarR family transcriptional regulator